MKHDAFYNKIIERLNGSLDADLFEHCVCDLLRDDWPRLVPIRGGTDAGMDGAVADGDGPAFPLVVTTAQNALQNLQSNLESYLRAGGLRRRVLFATSRPLTATRRRNLEKRAKKLGFELEQLYDQAAFADQLYGKPKWCQELLHLSGDPSPLSIVPPSVRPFYGEKIVGRHDDWEWLCEREDDRLLIGQPGSGKTSLLRRLTVDHGALFVVSHERGEIAGGIRECEPSCLIVDDAHVHPESIETLRHLRESTGAHFSIVASCWPGAREQISERMGLRTEQTRELSPLIREHIATVVRLISNRLADWVVGEIVDQAEGRPGLAATLTHWCRIGEFHEVWSGEKLRRCVHDWLERLIGVEAFAMLGAFSISGTVGMSMDTVASILGRDLLQISQTVAGLDAAGVITETSNSNLSVRPARLRHVAIRDVFFKGAGRLDCRPIIDLVDHPGATCRELIGAARLGADSAHSIIRELLTNNRAIGPWEEYAWLGSEESKWVLENHEGGALALALPFLRHIPERAVPLLLDAAVGDERALNSTPEHAMRRLADWVSAGEPGRGDAVTRRITLHKSVKDWLDKGGDSSVGIQALEAALSFRFSDSFTDPIDRHRYTIRSGALQAEELEEIAALWPESLELLKRMEPIDWNAALSIAHNWVFPYPGPRASLSEDATSIIKNAAERIVRDLTSLGVGRPGVLSRLRQFAVDGELSVDIETDPEYEVLFPERERGSNWEERRRREAAEARRLAKRWAAAEPNDVIKRLCFLEGEREAADQKGMFWVQFVCSHIAETARNPTAWYYAARDSGRASTLAGNFLGAVVRRRVNGWEQILSDAIDREVTRAIGVDIALRSADSSNAIITKALGSLAGLEFGLGIACLRGEIPEDVVLRLLNHEDSKIAGAVAEGEWGADPRKTVRPTLQNAWRGAVVRGDLESHSLAEIVQQDCDLAFEWLKRQIRDSATASCLRGGEIANAAASKLNERQRRDILALLHERWMDDEFISCLIDSDVELYAHMLEQKLLKKLHLSPLARNPDGDWRRLAQCALDRGYTAQQVAEATFGRSWGWCGDESEMWKGLLQRYESLLSDSDVRIKEVGRQAGEWARSEYERALKEERHEAVYGCG